VTNYNILLKAITKNTEKFKVALNIQVPNTILGGKGSGLLSIDFFSLPDVS
jgi:hypothetical protein